jgi:hypothetical protein
VYRVLEGVSGITTIIGLMTTQEETMDREDIEHLQKAYETFRQTKFPTVNRAYVQAETHNVLFGHYEQYDTWINGNVHKLLRGDLIPLSAFEYRVELEERCKQLLVLEGDPEIRTMLEEILARLTVLEGLIQEVQSLKHWEEQSQV